MFLGCPNMRGLKPDVHGLSRHAWVETHAYHQSSLRDWKNLAQPGACLIIYEVCKKIEF
jgi:hypothetical protein